MYSTNFVAVAGLVGLEPLTVPAGEVWILRDLDAYATGVISVPFTILWLHGVNGQAIAYHQWLAGVQETFEWRGRQVLSPGTTWDVRSDNGAVDVTVSGYVLTAP